jgi:hypothetical protein
MPVLSNVMLGLRATCPSKCATQISRMLQAQASLLHSLPQVYVCATCSVL